MSTADTIGLIFPITALLVGLFSQVHTATTWVRNVVNNTWNPPPLQIWLVCSLGVIGVGQCLLRSRVSPKHTQPPAATQDGCGGAMDVHNESKQGNDKSEACRANGFASDVQDARRRHSSGSRTGKVQNVRIGAKTDISSSTWNSAATTVSCSFRELQHEQQKDDSGSALPMEKQRPVQPMDKRQREHLYLQRVRWQELGPDRSNRWSGRRPFKELSNDQQTPWINLAIVDKAVRRIGPQNCIGPQNEVNLEDDLSMYGPSPPASETSMVVDYTGLRDGGERDALDNLAKGLSSLGFDALVREP